MAKEIERKFLLKDPSHTQTWFPHTDGNPMTITQAYLTGAAKCQIRKSPPHEGQPFVAVVITGSDISQYWTFYFRIEADDEEVLLKADDLTFRVRVAGSQAWLTIKGKSTEDGLSRDEWEFDISTFAAREMISSFNLKTIAKTRHKVQWDDLIIEVDEFHNANSGLMVAEIEFAEGDPRATSELDLPEFIGEEVTGDPKYYNSMLMKTPFNTWAK